MEILQIEKHFLILRIKERYIRRLKKRSKPIP